MGHSWFGWKPMEYRSQPAGRPDRQRGAGSMVIGIRENRAGTDYDVTADDRRGDELRTLPAPMILAVRQIYFAFRFCSLSQKDSVMKKLLLVAIVLLFPMVAKAADEAPPQGTKGDAKNLLKPTNDLESWVFELNDAGKGEMSVDGDAIVFHTTETTGT